MRRRYYVPELLLAMAVQAKIIVDPRVSIKTEIFVTGFVQLCVKKTNSNVRVSLKMDAHCLPLVSQKQKIPMVTSVLINIVQSRLVFTQNFSALVPFLN